MDIGIIFGFLGTWVLLFWAILAGGNFMWFVNGPSIILVIGASITIMFFTFPVDRIKKILSVAKKGFRYFQVKKGRFRFRFKLFYLEFVFLTRL